MTDYTSFDPNYSGSYLVLSNGNLTVTTTAPNDDTPYYQVVRAFEGKTSGKWCFSATISRITHADSLFCSINIGIAGFRLPNLTLGQQSPPINWLGNEDFSIPQPARTALAAASNGAGWFGNNVGDGFAGAGGTGAPWVDLDIIDLAVNVDTRLAWARCNGGFWNSNVAADPVAGTGGQAFEGFSGGSLTIGSRVWPAVSLGFFNNEVSVDFEAAVLAGELTGYSGWTQTYDFVDNMLYETVGQTFVTPTLWVSDFTPASAIRVTDFLVNIVASITSATQIIAVIYDSDGAAGAPGTLLWSGDILASGIAPPGVTLVFSGTLPVLASGHKYYVGYISNAASQQGGARTATTNAYVNGSGSPSPGSVPGTFPTPISAASNLGPALEIVLGTPPAPPDTPEPFCGVHHTTSSFTASWTPSGAAATSYTVDWRKVGDVSFTEVTGITDTFLLITGLDAATPYEFKVKAFNADGESDFSELITCATIGRVRFLVCDAHWTITQPQALLYGLDHLAGLSVTGLLDGIPLEPTQVALDGTLTLPFPASSIVIGLGYPVQIQGLYVDAGTPTVQGRRKDITGITARVDASGGPQTGSNQPDGGAQIPVSIDPPWADLVDMIPSTPKQAYDTYVGPSGQTTTKLYTGDLRANVVPGWDEKGQPAIEQTLPLPLSLVALMPEILEGDTPEQAYSQKEGQKHESWPWGRR